jgi:hypothetical protein
MSEPMQKYQDEDIANEFYVKDLLRVPLEKHARVGVIRIPCKAMTCPSLSQLLFAFLLLPLEDKGVDL